MARPELLGIPPELRLKILRYCMVVGVLPLTTSPFNFRSASSQILRLSKQFHNEALPILYGENIFYFGDGMMMESKLMCINTHAKSMIRHVCLGDSVNLTTKKVFLKSLKGLRGFSILIAKIGMLHLSDPKRNKVFAVEETPPRTIVQDFSWKYRGVEVGVVLCFVSDAQDVLPPDLNGEAMVRYIVRLSGKGTGKKEMSLELDFEGWRDYRALMPNRAARK